MTPAPSDTPPCRSGTGETVHMQGCRARRCGRLVAACPWARPSHSHVAEARNQRETGLGLPHMLRVRLLGDLAIEVDGTAVEPPASRRARALLGWLALDRRMHPRSGLAARFWPDVLDESARTSLRSALSALRRALGPRGERYVIATRDEIGLADGCLVWTDVAEFERCVEENRLQDALALGR